MSFRRKTASVSSNLRLAVAGALLIASAVTGAAQSRGADGGWKARSAIPPVAVLNNPAPEYRSGEVSVAVRGNENPIIRLGLAQNGVTLIEFPASDRFFAINPGNPDLV